MCSWLLPTSSLTSGGLPLTLLARVRGRGSLSGDVFVSSLWTSIEPQKVLSNPLLGPKKVLYLALVEREPPPFQVTLLKVSLLWLYRLLLMPKRPLGKDAGRGSLAATTAWSLQEVFCDAQGPPLGLRCVGLDPINRGTSSSPEGPAGRALPDSQGRHHFDNPFAFRNNAAAQGRA